uniref:Autophagy protein 11 n=1 Tax=Echinococcus granulosus TaxID=6210 RepID=A0A068WKC0_ECHGR|nr:Autophagy protein 11 [Echinococcus granulosus]
MLIQFLHRLKMYVFLMSQCKLIEIDNTNLQDRFGSLTVHLARYYNLPQDHQILLTNGGCQLRELHEIDDHSAGEDPTNPIYVFSRDNTITPETCALKAPEISQNLLDALKTPTESTVVSFQKYLKGLIAAVREDGETVQRLDQEQRLMCEGWFVAQANFDHDMQEFRKALDVYWKDYANFCSQVGRWEANMSKFPSIKNRLRSVPLLPSLLAASAELMSESYSVYGQPRTLYDWVCLQMASSTPRRLSTLNFPGPLCSGLRLPSAANSSGDISIPVASSRLAPPPLLPQSRLTHTIAAGVASFYLSGSSPTTSQTDGDSGEGSTTVVSSLEAPLLELVEDSGTLLKAMQESPPGATLSQITAAKDDADNNSLLMVGEDEEEMVDASTQPRLAYVFSNLKAFADLLESAPRDPELSTEEEEEEGERGRDRVASRLSIPTPKTSANIVNTTTSFAVTSASSWPIPEEEEEMATSEVEETLVSPHSRARDLNWRLSRRNFSCHLARLSKLMDQAVQMQVIITEMAEEILIDCQLKRPEKHLRQALWAQNHRIVAITSAHKNLQATFYKIVQLKLDLAEALSMLQEQLQTFSSELTTKNRECLRCYKNLTSISKCSAVLDQLQDTPELYVKSLLEIVRRRRMTTVWSDINDRYINRLTAFQHTESRRRETLAQALKNHILAQIFRPLYPHFRAPRQPSRISLISTAASSSNKRLTTQSKCHSTSQLNLYSPSSAFRLPSNRPAEVRFRPLPPEVIDRSVMGLETSLPAVSGAEMRDLAAQLPPDLAEMILEALLQLEADEKEVAAGFLPNSYQREGKGEEFEARYQPQLRRRSRLASSPGALSLLPYHHQQSVDVSTSMADRLARIEETFANISTEDKAVSVAIDTEFAQGNVCDSHHPPSHPPSPPCESSDVYLSIYASQFVEKAPSIDFSTPQHFSSAFYSLHDSNGSGGSKDSESDSSPGSVVTPSNLRMSELLDCHNDSLQRLVGQINNHLPSPLPITLPTFTAGERAESYLSEMVTCLNQLVNHFEALKSSLFSSSVGATFESVGVQTLPSTHDATTECRPRDFALSEISPMLPITSMATSDGSVAPSTSREVPIRVPRHECVFSNFRPDDLVLFIPMVGSDRHLQQKTTENVSTGEKALSSGERPSLWGSRSLALLSSAIISSSLSSPDTGAVEQWRMLSNDGHVYFLHDDDFEAFNLTRLSSLPATSAPGRAPKDSSPSGIVVDNALSLANRALPYIVGVFQSKEKCISRKDENRFSLPRNFIFFRVRARPL